MRKWGLRILTGLGAVVLLLLAGVYGVSEAMIRRQAEAPLIPVAAATDVGAVARGRHLAQLYGCLGCHKGNLQGAVWAEGPLLGRLHASNLTRAIPNYTDAELARAIRAGVRPDGSQMWMMPSESWVTSTDAEMGDLLAFLRSHEPSGTPTPRAHFGPMARLGIIVGEFEPTSVWVSRARASPSFDAGAGFARGRHLAETVCSECHGSDLKGHPGDTPDLTIAASYDLAGFTTLMRTGVAADGKERGLMTEVSKSRFSHFTEQDVSDLHGYLTARAEQME
jgi:mono/diheme cytochrome c family protein